MSLTFTSQPPALVSLSSLEQAILSALAYSDVFDHPLTLEELHKFLMVPATQAEIVDCISGMDKVISKNSYYFLPHRDEIVDIRRARELNSIRAFRRARFYGRILGRLPFIRMVALTGSLAMLNLSKNRDMDYMLVARVGRVWTARAFALLIGRLARVFGDIICPNVIVSENVLAWNAKNLYTAREFAQMIPITGEETYHRLCAANLWIYDILPNADMKSEDFFKQGKDRVAVFQKLTEIFLGGTYGDFLESWEMNRKIARFKKQKGYGVETNFSADICQGNFDHHGVWALKAHEERLISLSLGARGRSEGVEL